MKILLPTTESIPAGAPVIGFSGGGFFLSWILGVAHGMKELGVPYDRCVLSGASSGAAVAALMLSGADLKEVRDWIIDCPVLVECFRSPTGATLKARALLESIFQRFIPQDMAMYNGKLYILLCDQHHGLYFINTYKSRDDLIGALLATTHVPYFSDGSYAYTFRGRPHVDGQWMSSREGVLMCRKSAFKILIDNNEDPWMHSDDKKEFYEVRDDVSSNEMNVLHMYSSSSPLTCSISS